MSEKIENKNRMGTEPIPSLLFKMSLPIIISFLVQSVYNLVDSIFVARLSEKALTAVSLCFPVQNIMVAFAVGTGIGTTALLSRYLGMDDKKRVGVIATHGLILAAASMAAFMLFGIFFTDFYAKSQSTDPEIIQYTKDYLYVILLFCGGVFFQIFFEKTLQSTGNTVYTMITQGTGAILNIILDPIMIFGLFGFPKLGVTGAALATVIGQTGGSLVGVYFHSKKNRDVNFIFRNLSFHMDNIKQIFSIGLPSVLISGIGSVVLFFINNMLYTFGASAVAAYGIMYKLQSFSFMPMFGISNALLAIVSYNYGAKNKERIREAIKIAFVASFVIVGLSVVLMWIFSKQLFDLFSATDVMREIGVPMIRIVSLSFIISTPSVVGVGGIFQAIGNWKFPVIQSFLRQVILLLPIFYIFTRLGSLNFAWWAFPIAEILNAIVCVIFLRKDIREKIDIL
ncbi:MATE efflux family protein [Anaerococcus lactolyticus ATCC 51172]|uniref:Probable multidrug resistance protein NorM n=1 Tax=Anaerococcus lactolyticus ATCC 51172 TaxID=525254 RepID=C2BFH8_9FIRM|nr:MATE family efflux transporter [Anaerococcus lactolyticus]EEI86265.1 MATE efflux family protein [Anaerococcus lactolyticus ATCC 51172]